MDEGMTMVYRAADPAALGALKPGDKIRFAPDRVNGQFTATKIEKAR
jgi:Cu(I)/Ag(I) efflux system protein CusF